MINLEKKLGPWSLRVWGLVVNLAANAVALYGAAGMVRDGSRLSFLVVGCLITVICLLVLAVPSRAAAPGDRHRFEDNKE